MARMVSPAKHKNKKSKPTRSSNIIARERDYEAVELRKAGATYRQIGQRLGISKQSAHKHVKSALRELKTLTDGSAEDIRRIELERLDSMHLGIWDKARRGDVFAIDRVIKIMARRAELLGLDEAPRIPNTSAVINLTLCDDSLPGSDCDESGP